MTKIREWMTDNFLKPNNDKSDICFVLGSKCLHDKVNIPNFRIGSSYIVSASKVRNLGTYFDMGMTLNHHISEMYKSSSFHLCNIGLTRKYLTNYATETSCPFVGYMEPWKFSALRTPRSPDQASQPLTKYSC